MEGSSNGTFHVVHFVYFDFVSASEAPVRMLGVGSRARESDRRLAESALFAYAPPAEISGGPALTCRVGRSLGDSSVFGRRMWVVSAAVHQYGGLPVEATRRRATPSPQRKSCVCKN